MSLLSPRKGSTWRGGEESWCENTIQVQILRVILLFCCCLVAPSVGTGAAALWHWSNFEEIPHVQWQRRSHSKTVGGAKLYLESNPTPTRDAQTNLLYTRAQRPHRDRQNCVCVSPAELWVSSGLPQGQRLWVQQTWVQHKPSWRRSLLHVQLFCDPRGL